MIKLSDVWNIQSPNDFKVHFGRWNQHEQPLEVFVRNRDEWKAWQEYRPARNDFNREFIFSLIQFYHEVDTWLFGGVFRVSARHNDSYEVELSSIGADFIGRLKIKSKYRSRLTRTNFENHYDEFEVSEILREHLQWSVLSGV